MDPVLPRGISGFGPNTAARPGQAPEASPNASLPWDTFDTGAYLEHNYRNLRDDDQQIIDLVTGFFGSTGIAAARGIDVGAGANLYPALLMLPMCSEITLWEHSAANVNWLQDEVSGYSLSWDAFWNQMCVREPYSDVADPRSDLAQRVKVCHNDLFELPPSEWDIGTMFFVAESISDQKDEFKNALRMFMACLRPGAPFAAAFMANSQGYHVGERTYPAVPVGSDDVSWPLHDIAHDVVLHRVGSAVPLRAGYKGMILAVGFAGSGDGPPADRPVTTGV